MADTELVLDGFPRSANTFATVAFQELQERGIKVAHHLHVPAQFQDGLKAGIPVCLLIREPADAAVSLAMRSKRHFDGNGLLSEYIRFHRSVAKLSDQVVVADFRVVINEFGKVIEKINEVFDSEIKVGEVNEEAEGNIRDAIIAHNKNMGLSESQAALPTESKKERKKELRAGLDEGL